jgi:hypothetical protein
MNKYPDLDQPPALGYIPDPDRPLKIFFVKLCGEELLHWLPASEVQEDSYGNMEVFQGAERVAWYAQPLVEYWAYEEAKVFLNPRWKEHTSSWGDEIREMLKGKAPVGADEAGGLWYDITPNRS